MRESSQRRLDALANKALGVVETALDEGDARVALRILDGLGLLSGEKPSIGTDDPEQLAEQREAAEASKREMRELQRLFNQ